MVGWLGERAGPCLLECIAKVYASNSNCSDGVWVPFMFQQQCSKESIHQLVLNAENLVREEVFLQQRIQQQLTQSSRRHHSHPQHKYTTTSGPVLTASLLSTKCNGGSNCPPLVSVHVHDDDNGNGAASAMKVNCVGAGHGKKPTSDCGARRCDQLKIKLVQVRLIFGWVARSNYPTLFGVLTVDFRT